MNDPDELTLEDYKILGIEPPEELKEKGAGSSEEQGAEWEEEENQGPTAEEKYELIRKLGTDEFYKKYPDEAPEGWKPPEQKEGEGGPPQEEPDDLTMIRITSGEHKGKTLADLRQEDPFAAAVIYQDYRQNRQKEVETQQQEEQRRIEEAEQELVGFANSLSTKAYQKNFEDLDAGQKKTVEGEINKVLSWMNQTGRGGGHISDAYLLMTQSSGKGKAQGLADMVSGSGAVPFVGGAGGEQASNDRFSNFMEMGDDQLAAAIERMDEGEFLTLMKEAPKELRDKHPAWPWR